MTFDRFDVVRVPFPFTDRQAHKNRPALVLSHAAAFNAPAGHSVMAMVTSAKHSVWPLDVPIADLVAATSLPMNADFEAGFAPDPAGVAESVTLCIGTGVSGLSPEIMGMGPVEACRQALARAGMSIKDIDLYEINEAFASQVLGSADDLGMDFDRLNVHGGAIALGHPFGSTGTRIMATLINGLQTKDKQFGLESMCVGGGQGMAILVERLS